MLQSVQATGIMCIFKLLRSDAIETRSDSKDGKLADMARMWSWICAKLSIIVLQYDCYESKRLYLLIYTIGSSVNW